MIVQLFPESSESLPFAYMSKGNIATIKTINIYGILIIDMIWGSLVVEVLPSAYYENIKCTNFA